MSSIHANNKAVMKLLRQVSPWGSGDLEKLFTDLDPHIEVDSEEDRILFRSRLNPNTVIVGVKCTCRLQAHAYAGGVFISALSTPGYPQMSPQERGRLYAPADPLLTWAVGRDLQQWLKQREGFQRPLDEIMAGAGNDLPENLLERLSDQQRVLGEGLFRFAVAFILLHELGHLRHGHTGCTGVGSILQEKEADRFAADWLLDSPVPSAARRLNSLFGVAVALLWITVSNVYLGPHEGRTHPPGYDRLFQILDHAIDGDDEKEPLVVWDFVSRMLFVHMDNAGYAIDPTRMQGTPREEVNYLIDLLSKNG